jgi:hypothetical protein
MKPSPLLAFICGMNLLGILVELSLTTIFVLPLGSDARFDLRNSTSSIDTLFHISHPLLLCLGVITLIDFKLDYSNKLHREESIDYPKALCISGIPNLIIKIFALTSINFPLLPMAGLAFGAIVAGVYCLGRVKPLKQWLMWFFGTPSFSPLQGMIQVVSRTSIGIVCVVPFLWIAVNWLINHTMQSGQHRLPLDQFVLFSSFSIPTIIILLRLTYTLRRTKA